MGEDQRVLLRKAAKTIGTLSLRCLHDRMEMGSLLTLSLVLEALLESDTDPSAYRALRSSFENFPHNEYSELEQLFGALLRLMDLAIDYDRSELEKLTVEIVALHQAQTNTLAN